MQAIASQFLGDALATFRKYRELGEAALEQVTDEELLHRLDPEGNSIAVVVKHLGGNMRSRWRDFLSSDGEKPDRMRDAEFEQEGPASRQDVLGWWDEGWKELFAAMDALRPTDLERTVTIRGEPLSVLQAILRQVTHVAYHVGQIVLLAKHLRGAEWRTLSIPRKR